MTLGRCRTCGATIHWLKTDAGRDMPVDPPGVEPADTLFDFKRHVSHFATCPQADRHRKPRHRPPGAPP